ncbi:alpha-ketoacid dehydrogenase subunit beta [Mesorhizobium sp. B3-1-3]|uniref:alpha-ketoacid dehydrogenase subunit beta n=1 Tax=unclassified Mesorhizobium TaxID=325217 RepID=UPI001129FDAE|nr:MULTISPECIES: transketolase C-terminal domain-containing protein [unclassified Mesorhizobium]TPI69546.1 alpha-ketoacid dehydrogenase subunit beta [Mesorhizobium sp. B3-1-8]TPI73782.1 alpha-ketoacid dehydrogenase subunit beta [Mesorhizobium sp. B3-1-3]
MAKIWVRQAVLRALDDAMTEDPTVIMMGEDIAAAGGPFKVTEGLLAVHGPQRVIDTPISEMAFMGAAVGAAVCGLKPIVEMMFIEFIGVALDQLTTQAATMRYLSRGKLTTPLVVRASAGAGQGFGCQHSQMLDHWFRGTPGLKVCVTSNARTTYGLLRSAIEDPDPVVVLEPRILYAEREEYEFDSSYRIPLGKAEIVRAGKDATLLACGAMVRVAKEAAENSSVDIEVIDMLTLWPWDRDTIMESVSRTGRLVTLEEATAGNGWGAEVVSSVAVEAFGSLKAPPHRITLPDAPVPYSGKLEARFLPSAAYVAEQVSALVSTNKTPMPWWRNAA